MNSLTLHLKRCWETGRYCIGSYPRILYNVHAQKCSDIPNTWTLGWIRLYTLHFFTASFFYYNTYMVRIYQFKIFLRF